MIVDDRTMPPLPDDCSACGGTYCCPTCHPIRPGFWLCGGCDGAQNWFTADGVCVECHECDTGWTPCEDCDGDPAGCSSCVPDSPNPQPEMFWADDPADRCEDCGDTRVCPHCAHVAVTAEALRLARERAGWSWAEAAHALNMSAVRLQRMEAGDDRCSLSLRRDRAQRLADRGGVPIEVFGWAPGWLQSLESQPSVSAVWGRVLARLCVLGDEADGGEIQHEAVVRRLGHLADALNEADEADAATAVKSLAEVKELFEQLTDVGDSSPEDDVQLVDRLQRSASAAGRAKLASRLGEVADRLQQLADLEARIHRVDALHELTMWLGPLFDRDPGTRAQFDRVATG